jgi:hypothetical protein
MLRPPSWISSLFRFTFFKAAFQPAQKARISSSTWVQLGAIMEKVIVQFANALGTVVAMILGIWLLPFDMQSKCDSAEAVAMLKGMVLQKINEYGGDPLLRATAPSWVIMRSLLAERQKRPASLRGVVSG